MKLKRRMVQCATPVNKSAVTRKSINGAEYVVVSSFTLPDNIVMNGGFYSAEEIAKSFDTLERTLAPIEHPTDSAGNYISASDPEAVHNFDAGAFNVNVTRENGRVHIEKHINIQVAMRTDKGKRLMDRIEELETNDSPRPIHTSVGVFLEVEDLPKPKTNEAGQEYTWIARNMFFDHDAILLDSVGAAQPGQGVGMAVNASGDEVEVERTVIDSPDVPEPNSAIPERPDTKDMRTNAEGDSFASIMDELQKSVADIVTADWIWLADVFDDVAIFETPQGYFQVPWVLNDGKVELTGIPIRVDRVVTYEPKVNKREGADEMKELILNALAKAGIETDGLSEDDLLAKYNELQAPTDAGGSDDVAQIVANAVTEAVKPLREEVTELKDQLKANDEAERTKLVAIVVASDNGLDEEGAKKLDTESLKAMAAKCQPGYGIDYNVNSGGQAEGFEAPTEMPK